MPPLTDHDAPFYVLGLLEPAEVALFEHRLCRDRNLAYLCKELAQLAASMMIAEARRINRIPPTHLLRALQERIRAIPQLCVPGPVANALLEANFAPPNSCDALIFSDGNGRIHWVNPAFTRLCGYTLDEVHGRTAGSFLRGPESEPDAMDALGGAVRDRVPTLRRIVNYHKNGNPYRVEIDLRPVSGGFIALERAV